MEYRNKILIVEDQLANIIILEELLSDKYLVRTASSGEEALVIAKDFAPDLILLDIMLPGIMGYETCRRMRATPALRHTKIIMVTAAEQVEERLLGYEVGADDYVTKPFDPNELLAKVRVYLRLCSVEETERLKSDLLALLHHKTTSPLNGMLFALDLLRGDTVDVEEQKALLDLIYQSTHSLNTLFQKGMKLCSLRAGSWNFHPVTIDLCRVIRDALNNVAARAVEHQVTVALELPDGGAMTTLDPQEMKEAVATLLDTAIRFSAAQGHVGVKVSRRGGYWCMLFTVATLGAEINPDFLPHAFEEFAAKDPVPYLEGQGLSLALARQILLAHGGTVSVTSTKRDEATFVVQVPIPGC
jgi:signal transduction histidine kinase